MKKKIIAMAAILTMTTGLMGCQDKKETKEEPRTESVVTTAANKEEASSKEESMISEAKAREIALADAGLKESEISNMRIKLETDDGIQEYEVDFYADNKEYDYDIDATDGTIRSKDSEIEDDFIENHNQDAKISREDAIKKVLSRIDGAKESDVRIHLDQDDGKTYYEGSVVYKEMEYDFEIDASDGNIVEWESESIYDD